MPNSEDRTIFAKRVRNDLRVIALCLRSCPGDVKAVAVESTFTCYWSVDGLNDAGFHVRLVNTAAVRQY